MTTAAQVVPNDYKQTDVGMVPADWDVRVLGDCADIKTGPFGSLLHEKDYVRDGTPIITVEHLGEQGVVHGNLPMVSDADKKRLSSFLLQANDIVFSRVGSVDRNSLITEKESGWLFSGRLLRIRVHDDVHSQYLSYYFHHGPVKQKVRSVAVGQTMASLNTQILKNIPIVLPTQQEQFAIAAVLSDVDALIAKLETLIEKKKNIQLGATQELLTGNRRLPGFSGKRKKSLLGEVVEIKKGQLITSKEVRNGNVPVIAGGKTPAYYHDQANRLGTTITISASGANAGFVAIHYTPIFASDCSTIEESPNYSIEYIYFLLKSMQDKLYVLQTGGAQPHVRPQDLFPILIDVPEKQEQAAIAQVFCDMDAQLQTLELELAKYRDLKQGIMQKLLTGKIRLG